MPSYEKFQKTRSSHDSDPALVLKIGEGFEGLADNAKRNEKRMDFQHAMENSMPAFALIYETVRRIPFGRVASYGQIARLAGNPRWPRVVGFAMRACRDASVPCHRVVHREGRLCEGFGPLGSESQRILLRAEGVEFLPDGRVDLNRFLWDGEDAPQEE